MTIAATGAVCNNITVLSGGTVITTSGNLTTTSGSVFTLQANATWKQAGGSAALPGTTRSIDNASTIEFNGTQSGLAAPWTYGNLIYSSSSTCGIGSGNTLTVNGNLTLKRTMRGNSSTSGSNTHSVGGNVIVDVSGMFLSGVNNTAATTGNSTWNIAGNVTISNGARLVPFESAGPHSGTSVFNIGGNLEIGTGSQVQFRSSSTANASSGAATISVKGNITNTGAIQTTTGATGGTTLLIDLNGTSAQQWTGVFPVAFPTGQSCAVQINNSVGVTLNNDVVINANNTLTLTSGKLTLGSNNIIVAGSISGGSASSYVATTGTGVLTRNSVGATDVLFPVGTATTYNPVTINNAGTADNFSVRVQSTFDNAPVDPTKVVNSQWTITEAVAEGSNATLTFQWNAADEAGGEGGFDRSAGIEIGRYSGSQWVGHGAVYNGGSDPYSAYVGNITEFSNFAVGNSGALPVQLASFVGSFINNGSVTLEWTTISEINNYGFYVERRAASEEQFTTVSDLIPGAGYTLEPQHYTWTDESATENEITYRLKQVDNDGLINYHGPITVSMNPTGVKDEVVPAVFKLEQNYPNPFNPSTIINYQLAVDNYTTLKVYNLIGKEVATLVNGYKTAGSHQVTFDASNLSAGVYLYKLQSGNPPNWRIEVRKLTLVK